MLRLPFRTERLAHWLPKSTPILFALMLLAGLALPLYTDEVGWRLQERAGIDGVDKLLSEQCGPNTLAIPPWFMWPVRWYSAFFNTAWPDPFAIRLSGVAYAMGWGALLLALIHRVARDGARRGQLTVLCCGLMGLGVMPWLLVWSRPEQPIILAATASLLIACGADADKRPRWWAPIAILMLGVVALSYHFKALILVPLFVASIVATGPMRRAWAMRGLSIMALLAVSAASGHYWFARLACPDDPLLAAQHASQSLGLQLLTNGNWAMAALRLIANYQLPDYVAQATPDITPMSNWLLPGLVGKSTQIVWTVGMVALWLSGFVLMVWTLVSALWRRRMSRPLWLAVVTLACVSVWCVSQVVRNVYEASFVLPLLTLAYALALSSWLPDRMPKTLRRIATTVGLALPVSVVAILAIYGPSLLAATGEGAYLPGQPYSVGLGHYDSLRREILAVAASCGIRLQNHPTGLLVDDVTYFTFMDTRLPDHKISVLEPQWSGSLHDPLAYLRARHSSGAVVACNALSPSLRAHAHARGGVCCIGPDQWQAGR
jgi:hypothetical protein